MNLFTGSNFGHGVRAMLPLAAGDVLDGATFGALAAPLIGQFAPVAMSLTAFSGSAQYAAISVLRAHGTVAAALLAAVALNARYLAMSAAVSRAMTGSRWRRAAACLLLTDAAWALAKHGDAQGTPARLAGAGATELIAWTVGTALGVICGSTLPNPQELGLDAAFPALFLWLLGQHLRDRGGTATALLGASVALALTPLLAPGIPILVSGVLAAAWSSRR